MDAHDSSHTNVHIDVIVWWTKKKTFVLIARISDALNLDYILYLYFIFSSTSARINLSAHLFPCGLREVIFLPWPAGFRSVNSRFSRGSSRGHCRRSRLWSETEEGMSQRES